MRVGDEHKGEEENQLFLGRDDKVPKRDQYDGPTRKNKSMPVNVFVVQIKIAWEFPSWLSG